MSKMEFIKKNILIIILVLIFVILASYFLVRNYLASKSKYIDSSISEETYEMVPKTYNVNEYTSIMISDDDMARIYLNDYINSIMKNIQDSYYLLDEEYRNSKFGNVDNYINYINNLKLYNNVDRYYKKTSNGYIIYGVYDVNGNYFVFKTKGVMQYSVYLDDKTIEIW